jgi:ADP-ribosylglycohydrolase
MYMQVSFSALSAEITTLNLRSCKLEKTLTYSGNTNNCTIIADNTSSDIRTMTVNEHRASGCLFGLALGDSLGGQTEFLTIDAIVSRFPPDGPLEPTGLVTDDTQMALAVGEALLDLAGSYAPGSVEQSLRKTFVNWYDSEDNTRAPGRTCLDACEKLKKNLPWIEATVQGSKGCGANMRVAPVGLLPRISDSERAAIAQFQAALTHGHPTALAASDLTAFAVAFLRRGGAPMELVGQLRSYARAQSDVYHTDWLGDLWKRPGLQSPSEFISRGWAECLDVLNRLEAALHKRDYEGDPCTLTGAGWVAEEAFATGMLCFLLFYDNPKAAIKRAAVSSGDSDSIAALTGAFAGAHTGVAAWPSEWLERIEYREQLHRLGCAWD